jgi:D-threo-aldose 1-dehydrogenase
MVVFFVGGALRARPDLAARATVTTKAGRTLDGPDHSYDAVMRSVETSLRRVGLARFAVVYIHDTMGVPMQKVLGAGGALPALQELKEQGVIGAIGTATDDPEINAAYIETGAFDAAVVPRAWSLINLLAEKRILPAAIKHNVGLVMATTLERGLLAHGPRQGAYYFDRSYSPAIQANVAEIQTLCAAYGIPLVAAALQWSVRHPQIASTIPGARTPQEAIANANAANYPIPDAFWQDLAPLIHDWGDNSNQKRAGTLGAAGRD